MKTYTIASFYKFVPLDEFEELKEPFLSAMNQHHILGTIILAHEGINGSFAGLPEDVRSMMNYLRCHPPFASLQFRETYDDFMPFEKAKVKFRKEIVTLGVPGIDPLKETGMRVSPEAWNEVITSDEVVVIDTRNQYEYDLGTFKNAINPHTENFREFPEFVKTHLLDKKDKKIAMFCTGGIRCEKSTAYLLSLGFKDVVQLEGGILNYLETMPREKSLFGGGCFVFDERLTIDG